jgi:hypothetical protein
VKNLDEIPQTLPFTSTVKRPGSSAQLLAKKYPLKGFIESGNSKITLAATER